MKRDRSRKENFRLRFRFVVRIKPICASIVTHFISHIITFTIIIFDLFSAEKNELLEEEKQNTNSTRFSSLALGSEQKEPHIVCERMRRKENILIVHTFFSRLF
jgi:hypothetical protein